MTPTERERLSRRLSPEERAVSRAALEAAERISADTCGRREGAFFDSTEDIHQVREERTRETA